MSAPGSARTGRTARWLSGRAVAMHATAIVVVPSCLLGGWWQLHRALSGNVLSWAYTFEWPLFAGLAAWAWWVLVHLDLHGEHGARPEAAVVATRRSSRPKVEARRRLLEERRAAPKWDQAAEDPALRAYNEYLAVLQTATAAEARRARRPDRAHRRNRARRPDQARRPDRARRA